MEADQDRIADKLRGAKVVSIEEARELAAARRSFTDKSLIDLPEVAGFKIGIGFLAVAMILLYLFFFRR